MRSTSFTIIIIIVCIASIVEVVSQNYNNFIFTRVFVCTPTHALWQPCTYINTAALYNYNYNNKNNKTNHKQLLLIYSKHTKQSLIALGVRGILCSWEVRGHDVKASGPCPPQCVGVCVPTPRDRRICSQRNNCVCRHSDVGSRTGSHTDSWNLCRRRRGTR